MDTVTETIRENIAQMVGANENEYIVWLQNNPDGNWDMYVDGLIDAWKAQRQKEHELRK